MSHLSKNCAGILAMMMENMQAKFTKYWRDIKKMNHLLILGFVLDPSYKLGFTRHCLNFMFSKESEEDKFGGERK